MRALVIAAVLVLFSAQALASASCNIRSERFGSALVRVGDSERRVIEVAGPPDLERRLETREGGGAGYRADYFAGRNTIQIYIQGGVVTRICRVRG